jgi:hypothetical protein
VREREREHIKIAGEAVVGVELVIHAESTIIILSKFVDIVFSLLMLYKSWKYSISCAAVT